MKKIILPLVALTGILASCGQQQTTSPIPPTATAPTTATAPVTVPNTTTDSVNKINSLSPEELQALVSKADEWKVNNPQATDKEANEYFKSLLDSSHTKKIQPQWSIGDWTKLGPYQGALCNSNLIACGKTKIYKDQANNWSANGSGYSNGYNGGKIDAARHTYWNALMTRGVSRQWAQSFSYAHEQDSPPSNAVGWNLRNMDLYNNDQGQNIGASYPANQYTDSQIEGVIKYYINSGLVRVADGRLNTGAQGGCKNLVPSNSPEAFVGWYCQ